MSRARHRPFMPLGYGLTTLAGLAAAVIPLGCTVARTVGTEELTDGAATDDGTEMDSDDADDDAADDAADADAGDGDITGPQLDAIDLLFVIDNSGSMGDEQARLVSGLEEMVDAFDARGVDYRIAFTTTDDGNVECSATSPEGGQIRLTKCTDREDEFTWPKVNPQVQAYEVACSAKCPANVADNLEVLPTTTATDDEASARAWIESIDGVTNIADATVPQAIGCFAPQGVDGCGFESPLSTARKALLRFQEGSGRNEGFLRDEAALAIVIVTDEADCSAESELQASVFDRNLSEDEKVFWSDPTSSTPTSAICWHAGVACAGNGQPYDDCVPTDLRPNGDSAQANELAVLTRVDELSALVRSLQASKREVNDRADVLVSVIAGVPQGYASGSAQIEYRQAEDANIQDAFGIAYGCTSTFDGDDDDVQSAIPPVRLRAFAEAFDVDDGTRNMASICAVGFEGGLMHVVAEFDRLNQL